jgi:hypothetical protein
LRSHASSRLDSLRDRLLLWECDFNVCSSC